MLIGCAAKELKYPDELYQNTAKRRCCLQRAHAGSINVPAEKENEMQRKKIVIVTGNDRVASSIEDDVRLILGDTIINPSKRLQTASRLWQLRRMA